MVTERTLCPIVVGRESELAALEDALIDAARADGRFVVIAGDAGMGKTRLTSETQARAAKLGFTTLRGGCAPTDVAIPYLPLLEAAGNRLARSDPAQVRALLGSAAGDLGRLFPQMAAGVHTSADNDGGEGTMRLFESVVMLLRALSDDGPLLLIIEDLQWSDPATRDLVDYLARRAPSLPFLVLVTYRSDELHRRHPLRSVVHGWRRGGLADFVEIAPLQRSEVRVMSRAILDDDVSEEFRDYIYERTEGSPLALEEMLREAIDRGDIFPSEHGWDRKPLTQLRIPRAVEEVVLLRLDRLDDQRASVLNAASVLGRTFSYNALAPIIDLDTTSVRSALDALVKDQLLEPDSEQRGRFRFRHALIQEAVYDQILSPHRDELHLRVASALREAHAPAVEVGGHLLRGGQIDDAVPVLLDAAEDAMTNFAAMTAVDVYRRVLPHISDPALRARVLCRLGESLWRSSQPSAAERYLREAIAAVGQGDDHALAARCRHLLGACLHDQGRDVEEEAEYVAAMAMLTPLGPTEDLAMVYLRLARLRWSRSDDPGTIAMARDAIATAESAKADAVRIWAGAYLGAATADRGDTDAGLELLQRSCDDAEAKQMHWIAAAALRLAMDVLIRALRYGDASALLTRLRRVPAMSPADEAVAGCIDATIAFDKGDVTRCVTLVEAAQKLARRAGHEHIAAGATLLRAAAHLAADELVAARSLLPPIESTSAAMVELLLPIAVTLDIVEGEGTAAADKATSALAQLRGTEIGAVISEAAVRAYLAAHRLDDAEQLVASTHNFAGPARAPYLERATGSIALESGRIDDAVRMLDNATATFARTNSRWEELWTRMALARARAAAGDVDAAAAELATVAAIAGRAGISPIARVARETHVQLRLPGAVPAAAGQSPGTTTKHALLSQPYGATVAVAAAAVGAMPTDGWRAWGEREARRQHGIAIGSPDALTATFTVADTDDSWTSALRFAMGLRDKGALLDMQVRAAVAGAIPDATGLLAAAAAGDILASGDVSSRARAWLGARQLAQDATGTGAIRLRRRVSIARSAEASTPDGSEQDRGDARNEFVLEGDYWSVRYGGITSRLRNTKGLHDIARLMAAVGTDIAAVDLIGARTPSGGALTRMVGDGFGIEGDAGEVLDPAAREQYRSRLLELDEELMEFSAANDPVRAERVRDERAFLIAELRSSVGLRGRTRRAIDPAERARKAVTWRIRDAIARAEAAHTAFGRHLRRSVRTGTFCVYDPLEPTPWVLARERVSAGAVPAESSP